MGARGPRATPTKLKLLRGETRPSRLNRHEPRPRSDMPRLPTDLERTVFEATKRDSDLKRAYWFARSEVWLTTPHAALKRSLGALRLLGARWSERLPDPEREAVEWLSAQITLGVVLAFVRIAGLAYRQSEDEFKQFLTERLAEGIADYRSLQEMSRYVDKFVVGVLTSAGLNPAVATAAMGAFVPEPPIYLEPATEVVLRLAASPVAAARLPRFADAAIGRSYLPPAGNDTYLDPYGDECGRLLRLVLAFVERQARVPVQLLAAFAQANGTGRSAAVQTVAVPERLFPDS